MNRGGASARLRRVLAILPYLVEHPETNLEELSIRFGVSRRVLERDLVEILPMCGLPPYTPDRLIDVQVDLDGNVSVRFAEYFSRPVRLTPAEGVSVLAAGRSLLAVEGAEADGALASALAKLEAALGASGRIDVSLPVPDHLEVVRGALETSERIEIDYYSYGRNAETTRAIDPWAVFHAFGNWYCDAYCHLADAERLFRVDRIRAVRPTGVPATPPSDRSETLVYTPSPTDPLVTLELAPSARWVVEHYPVESVEEAPDGRLRVGMRVSATAWLERVLLRLGPDAEVLDPPEWQATRAAAARRVLARYRSGRAFRTPMGGDEA